uniref:ATP synthase subunit a n=1 Tax=Pomphorhynchus bulbocolli TaxID=317556 RepID=A0A806GX31_9BILA|nr:ATP synthase F0 subunit 6 [Pomphorhynchus bulbocolli]AFJ54187.1 ATP synthase F0 subunit 6 [Pomphorhynchus bulbocolli]
MWRWLWYGWVLCQGVCCSGVGMMLLFWLVVLLWGVGSVSVLCWTGGFVLGVLKHGSLYLSSFMVLVAMVFVALNIVGLLVSGVWTMSYGSVLMLSFSCWLWGVFVMIKSSSLNHYLAHFSIMGIFGVLGCVLPVIELVSVIVRPLTLGVRLATNISSGHVLLLMMALVLGVSSLSIVGFPLWFAVVCLELFVALLQGLIYASLVVIYVE